MFVTFYKKPDGRTVDLGITNVYPEDAKYFEDHNTKISMEEVGGQYAVYADTGRVFKDGEPDEFIVLSGSRTCEDTLHELRLMCEGGVTWS